MTPGTGLRPPYMFDRFDHEQGEGVSVTLDVESSTVTLAVHGLWGRFLRRDVHVAVRKCMSEHPASLVVDLHDLQDPHAGSLTTWIRARRMGVELQPAVQVLVNVPAGTALATRMRRTGITQFLPTFPTLAQAHAAAAEQSPLTDRLSVHLTPHVSSAAQARAIVTDACAAWRMDDISDRARLVVSELVANAIHHAGPPISVAIARHRNALQVIVRDGDPTLPRTLHAAPSGSLLPPRGLGLAVVDAAVTSWGAMPTHNGKAVWARIQRHPDRR